jgi:flavin reductase (DIM6/NTAB) family NADH-FMN oxidoreductase RutF
MALRSKEAHMFYRPADGHGLPHNPFTAIVAPRPIAWISTRGPMGDNLAPYSFFNAVAYSPPQIMFASTGIKDTVRAIRATGVFAVNIVEAAMLEVMSETSAALPPGTDEFVACNVAKAACTQIDCPRAARAPATLECRVLSEVTLAGRDNIMMIAEVVGVHLRDDCMVAGRFDVSTFRPAARLGYMDYTAVETVREVKRPDER